MYTVYVSGWRKHPFSWCTVQGRALISKGVGKKIDFRECQRRCIARKGCMAIEFWEAYNYACFVCTNTKLIRPYTNKKDLAYPAHVWVQSTYDVYFRFSPLKALKLKKENFKDFHFTGAPHNSST